MDRYAIHLLPARNSLWWKFGCAWLGRDPFSRFVPDPPVLRHLELHELRLLTEGPARLGFQIVLRRPFRLDLDAPLFELDRALRLLSERFPPLRLDPLAVRYRHGFVALHPRREPARIWGLLQEVNDCVASFTRHTERQRGGAVGPASGRVEVADPEAPFYLRLSGAVSRDWGFALVEDATPYVASLSRLPMFADTLLLTRQARPEADFEPVATYGLDGTYEAFPPLDDLTDDAVRAIA